MAGWLLAAGWLAGYRLLAGHLLAAGPGWLLAADGLAAGWLVGWLLACRQARSEKWSPVKKLTSDGNLNYIITWCSNSVKIKLQYIKNTLHVAHFHINMVLSTRNMFKEIHVIKSRGALGTGFTYAPICRAGGKPSTWFPPGTRRADHFTMKFLFVFSLFWRSSEHYFQHQPKFRTLFIWILKFLHFSLFSVTTHCGC